eukprot:GHVH01007468.1.p1 GENE.GHVH01007468.1~~GHVH01007468.1.p1  ORF type:complete len:244 (+),score=31.76 GHVH01007468.1:105-836(+)
MMLHSTSTNFPAACFGHLKKFFSSVQPRSINGASSTPQSRFSGSSAPRNADKQTKYFNEILEKAKRDVVSHPAVAESLNQLIQDKTVRSVSYNFKLVDNWFGKMDTWATSKLRTMIHKPVSLLNRLSWYNDSPVKRSMFSYLCLPFYFIDSALDRLQIKNQNRIAKLKGKLDNQIKVRLSDSTSTELQVSRLNTFMKARMRLRLWKLRNDIGVTALPPGLNIFDTSLDAHSMKRLFCEFPMIK